MKETTADQSIPQILVIDDDPLFRARMASAGKKQNVNLTICASLREVNAMNVPKLFDAIIMDYYLDDMMHHLKGTELAGVLEATPVLLVSNTEHALEEAASWPSSVRRFVSKRIGFDAILRAAIGLKKQK